MNEELIAKMQVAIVDLPVEKVANFHARFLAYLEAGIGDDLRAAGDIEFGNYDAAALGRVWQARRP